MIDEKPTHLDLFSGIGGFALAAQWAGFRTIGFCEIDKYCQKVLAKNFLAQPYGAGGGSESRNAIHEGRRASEGGRASISEKSKRQNDSAKSDSWTASPIFGNIFDLDGRDFQGVHLITGGFPCQPFSVAGKRRGAADDRAIWPEMLRVIKEARPAWVLGENVPGIIPMELDNVLSDLEGIGYATRTFIIPACAVDAKHRRDRVWIVANSNEPRSQRRDGAKLRECAGQRTSGESDSSLANATTQGRRSEGSTSETLPQSRTVERSSGRGSGEWCEWLPEPDVGRVAHGIPSRVDRLKGLGNAIVPQVAYEVLKEIAKQLQ